MQVKLASEVHYEMNWILEKLNAYNERVQVEKKRHTFHRLCNHPSHTFKYILRIKNRIGNMP